MFALGFLASCLPFHFIPLWDECLLNSVCAFIQSGWPLELNEDPHRPLGAR